MHERFSALRRPLLLVAVIGVGAVLLHRFDRPRTGPSTGDPIGDVRVELTDGTVYRLVHPPAEVVVITFWAQWCGPCRQEVPILNRLHAAGRRIVGIAVDAHLPLATVKQQALELGIQYPVGLAESGLADRLDVRAIPTTFVVAPDGRVALAHAGGISHGELASAIGSASAR